MMPKRATLSLIAILLAGSALIAAPADAGYGPTVTWVAPLATSRVSGAVTLEVQVDGLFAIQNVKIFAYYYPGAVSSLQNLGGGRWRAQLDTTGIDDGEIELRAKATDVNGAITTSDLIVFGDNCDTTAILYSPADGALISGKVTAAATVTAIARCQPQGADIYIDGDYFDTTWTERSGTYQLSIDTRLLSNGTHTLAVGGNDGNREPISDSAQVTVHNIIPTTLTLARSDPTLTYGDSVQLTATLKRSIAPVDTVDGQPVTFYAKRFGESGYRTVGAQVTDSSGVALVSLSPNANTAYYARFDGSGDWATSKSSVHEVDVRPVVTGHLSSSRIGRNETVRLSGQVSPSHPNKKILIQEYQSTRWVSIGSTVLTTKSAFVMKLSTGDFGYCGRHRLRAFLPADTDHLAGSGDPLRLRVC